MATKSGSAAALTVLLGILLGCATDPHENFKNIMAGQVGKDMNSPSARAARNPSNLRGTNTLPNGNLEEAYAKANGACRHYFEIDRATRKIVGWRYEGTRDACAIYP